MNAVSFASVLVLNGDGRSFTVVFNLTAGQFDGSV